MEFVIKRTMNAEGSLTQVLCQAGDDDVIVFAFHGMTIMEAAVGCELPTVLLLCLCVGISRTHC